MAEAAALQAPMLAVSSRLEGAASTAASFRRPLPPVKVKRSVKNTASSGFRTPVSPRTFNDMIGSQTDMATGLTNPYNTWGPTSRYGYLEDVSPTWTQKRHFGGNHDALIKQRLVARKFGHVRHTAYPSALVEPTEKTSAWLDTNRREFWRTDVEKVLRKEEDRRRAREKELVEIWANEKAHRNQRATNLRDVKFQAYRDLTAAIRKDPGFRNNKSGAPTINIITRERIGEEEAPSYKTQMAAWRAASRALLLQEKSSGARMYNVINWLKCPPCRELPPKPEAPPPPPPPLVEVKKTPLNTSKGALSYGPLYGPYASLD